MLTKRYIYNQNLTCVALEIIANQQTRQPEELLQPLIGIIHNIDTNLPLFIPYALRSIVELLDPPLENPVILKLNASDINEIYPEEELKSSLHSIALMIDNTKQLDWLNIAEYIALSEELMVGADISKIISFIQSRDRKIIAYNIANLSCFDQCKGLTVDYFCGDFLFQPCHKTGQDMAANKVNLLMLINKLQNEDVDFNEIIDLIKIDPLLSYQLLRVANSAAYIGYQTIESIQEAVMRLGLKNLKNWVMVLSMKNVTTKPLEVVESGLIRAKMAEKLAVATKALCVQSAYTSGLFSVLDSLLDSPMDILIDKISLTDEVKDALLHRSGKLGNLISIVVSYEEGHWEELESTEYFGQDLSEVYIECLEQVSYGKQAMA